MPTSDMDAAPRSLLFVPGNRPERFAKATATGADVVIIDLEDSVPFDAKLSARSATATWLEEGTAWVRLNPVGTSDCSADIERCAAAPGVAGVVVPKAEEVEDLDWLAGRLRPGLPLIALVESARGLLAAHEIACHPSVRLLAFGNLDFAADCGMLISDPEEPELLPARMHLVVASRAASLPGPVDGVTTDVREAASAERDARRASRMGFSGKLCVHPTQVEPVHRAFAPSPEDVAWARRILETVSSGVGVVDGAMVDRPVLLRAEQILRRS